MNWQIKKLEDVVLTITNGYSGGQNGNENGIPITRIETIQNQQLDLSRIKYAEVSASEKEKYLLEEGDILFSHINSMEHIGKVALITKDVLPILHGVNLLKIKTDRSMCNPYFLYYYFQTYFIKEQIARKSRKAVNQASINQSQLRQIILDIPPLSTQQQIVEKLDAIRKLQELNNKEIEKAEELFNSGISTFFNFNGVTKPLGSICRVVGGGTPSKENKSFYTGQIPWVTIKDLISIEISDSKEHINEEAINNSAVNLVEASTILVATRVGLGKMGMAKAKLTFNQDIKGLICFKGILPYYLLYFLLSQAKFIEKSGQGATVKGINQDLLKRIKIPTPEISIQKETVNKLDFLFRYKTQLFQTSDLLSELFESTLNKAMKGELVN